MLLWDPDSERAGDAHSVDGGPVLASGKCPIRSPLWPLLLMQPVPRSASVQVCLVCSRRLGRNGPTERPGSDITFRIDHESGAVKTLFPEKASKTRRGAALPKVTQRPGLVLLALCVEVSVSAKISLDAINMG